MPTLFVCGKNDIYLLCSSPAANKTKDFVTADKYRYFEASCGHNLLQAKSTDNNFCKSQAEVDSVFKAITDHIVQNNGGPTNKPTASPTSTPTQQPTLKPSLTGPAALASHGVRYVGMWRISIVGAALAAALPRMCGCAD